MKETLEQAVKRIRDRYWDGDITLTDALRDMAAWTYEDAGEICRKAESWADADGSLQRRAAAIRKGE